ncbi:unnamed protein product [Gongylonema pulchrum]|uniref:Metalloendopeptidase n=1 Tax=Gongylonema pulchrum TaxID=637853 RepID=A0A183ELH3_9BILA|nr:unnamed protein product [Gongylonema pulchrum]
MLIFALLIFLPQIPPVVSDNLPTSAAGCQCADDHTSQFTWGVEVEDDEEENDDHDNDEQILYLLTNNSNAVDCSTTVTWGNSSTQIEYGKNDEAQTVAAKIQHNSVRQKTLLWPGGRIPYTISPSYSESSRSIIQEAFEEYMRQTCIRFIPKQLLDLDFIDIIPDDGCYSMVGNNGGRQAVSLGDGCLRKGIAIHELMHVLGFFHEQSRADRDSYVDIHWENVDPTLVDIEIGQRRGFSNLDVWKINKLYNCTGYSGKFSVLCAKKTCSLNSRNLGNTLYQELCVGLLKTYTT